MGGFSYLYGYGYMFPTGANNSRRVFLDIKGPHIIRPNRKYKFRFIIRTKGKKYFSTKLSIARPLNISFPLAPLDWDCRDQGLTNDRNWQLHYYELGDIERESEISREIQFISNPRGKFRLHILPVSLAGYLDLEHKGWAEIVSENVTIFCLGKISLSLEKFSGKLTMAPSELLPAYSETVGFGWEPVNSGLPPLEEVNGYRRGIIGNYGATTGNETKTITVCVYEFDNGKFADKYFDKQCDRWLEMHHLSSETIRASQIMKSQGIVWRTKNGLIYNWRKRNLIFSIYGVNLSARDVDNFVKLMGSKVGLQNS